MKQLYFVFLIAITMLCASCGKEFPSRMPDIQLADEYGNSVSAADLTKDGRPVMLSFYATWCDPCAKELDAFLPHVQEWKEKYGVEIVLVSIDRYPSQVPVVMETVEKKGWTDFKVLFDTEGRLMRELEIETIPTVFFIAPNGEVVHKTVGYDLDTVQNAEQVLQSMAKKQTSDK